MAPFHILKKIDNLNFQISSRLSRSILSDHQGERAEAICGEL
jgi:hypothetical protein